jgi:hypothetical protein
MTAPVANPTPTSADAARDRRHADERRIALGAIITLAGACSLVLVNASHVGSAWMHWAASPVALTAALTVVVAGELGWEQTVATARAAGLVAPPSDRQP